MTEGATLEERLRLIADAGYAGVESDPPAIAPAAWRELCATHGLEYVAAIYAADAAAFRLQLEHAVPFGPMLFNAQSGRDRMSFQEGCEFFAEVLRIERDLDVPVCHETHRRRLLFTPWTTVAYLERFPELKITADFSHWVVVCESLLGGMEEEVAFASTRAVHIHGRVGYEQGPQVSDPRARQWTAHVARFDDWWDAIREARHSAGADCLTFTPEYGPPNYMQTQPHTGEPLGDLWDICLWSANRLRQRWGNDGSEPRP